MMSYPWITAILGGTGLDPLDEDACLPLPVSPEELAAYKEQYPKAELWDLQDCQRDSEVDAILKSYQCTIYDLISEDASLEEVNQFLWAAYNQTRKRFEDGICDLLRVKQERTGGKLTTEDMMRQAVKWNLCTESEEQPFDQAWEQKI